MAEINKVSQMRYVSSRRGQESEYQILYGEGTQVTFSTAELLVGIPDEVASGLLSRATTNGGVDLSELTCLANDWRAAANSGSPVTVISPPDFSSSTPEPLPDLGCSGAIVKILSFGMRE